MVETAACTGGAAPTEEAFAETERQLLIVLVTEAWTRIRHDPAMAGAVGEAEAIVRRLSGTDTVLVARRAYPSNAGRDDIVQIARRLVKNAGTSVRDGKVEVRTADLDALAEALDRGARRRD